MVLAILMMLVLVSPQAATPTLPLPTQPPAAPASKPCGLDAAGKYHMGCGVTMPRLIDSVEPRVSDEARAAHLSGYVLVSLTVNAQGNPVDVRIKTSKVDKNNRSVQQNFEVDAVEAVKQYRFKPATFAGKSVPFDLNVEFDFK